MRERNSFLDWRRSLAVLEQDKGLLMTPFERNLEMWRQLWRVIERSDLVVQIVDARNPLLFRCEDLEIYVKEIDSRKKNLLLVNKADMLSIRQRKAWAEYFDQLGIPFKFFSASLSKKKQEDAKLSSSSDSDEPSTEIEEELEKQTSQLNLETTYLEDEIEEEVPENAQILDAEDLLELFKNECPQSTRSESDPQSKVTIGFVGYPNVGKSSTLNALIGSHKVAVGSTPGKTKHFQTIHLPPDMILCDCPGLVFPSFATTKAEMVCNGILPIDQLREVIGPSGLIAQRIPKVIIEAVYGFTIYLKNLTEEELLQYNPSAPHRDPTAEELLCSFAVARGYTKSSQGNPDEARAARHLLKDYVQGKLLYVQPPPGMEGKEFNQELYQNERYIKRKQKEAETAKKAIEMDKKKEGKVAPKRPVSSMTSMDAEFFGSDPVVKAKTVGKFASNDFARAHLGQPASSSALVGKKGHKKGKKNVKQRTQWTALD